MKKYGHYNCKEVWQVCVFDMILFRSNTQVNIKQNVPKIWDKLITFIGSKLSKKAGIVFPIRTHSIIFSSSRG